MRSSFRLVCAGVITAFVLAGCSSEGSDAANDGTSATSTGGDGVGGTQSNETGGTPSDGGSASGGSATGSGGISGNSGGNAGVGGTASGGTASGGAGSGGTASGGASSGGAGTGGSGDTPRCASNQVAKCSGTGELACHFGGAPGNYEVTVGLGGPAAGDMYVEAEAFRRMLGVTKTQAGQTQGFSFVVNVRQPEGQPVQNGDNDGTPGLDVYIRGTAPQLSEICVEPVQAPPTIWIAGDSTVCDQGSTDYSGWGQHLPQFFNEPVTVANYADSGESSGSFLNSGKMFGAIKARWKAGDFLFVQMGHNDKTTTAATFQANMTSYVTQAKAAGVNVVLVTPISRVGYTLAQEHVNSTGANLPQIIRDIGKSQNVAVIDLTVTTWNWLQTIDWKQYFALGTDKTHPNPKGADVIAGFVRDAIQAQDLAVGEYLR